MDTDYQSPLSMRYATDILSLVYEKGKIMATDLLRIAKNYKTVVKTAEKLEDLGLLTEHLESHTRQMRVYELTTRGKSVAAHLVMARDALYGPGGIPSAANDTDEKGVSSAETQKKKSSDGENDA